jgi:hypothetical protein
MSLISPDTTLSEADAISWAPEVIVDSTGKWCRNSLRFATKYEAEMSARELSSRWFSVRSIRAAPAIEPVNYRFENGQNVRIEEPRLFRCSTRDTDNAAS